MAALDDLIARIDDPALRADLERELKPLIGERELGLVFERHLPEKVRLPGLPIRRGAKVEVTADPLSPVWRVVKVASGLAALRRVDETGVTLHNELPVAELVVVREFGDPIHPGLRSVGRIERSPDKPFHAVINAENFHALETLLYTCEGQVDAIYIDPPYNTRTKDWKYNNDYVDPDDRWKHSKWLAFMERRLILAKRLLKPDGVLVVTIDEHEVHHLSMLLGQVFREYHRPIVTIVVNSAGTIQESFYQVEEFALFAFPPGRHPAEIDDDLFAEEGKKPRSVWQTMLRAGGINDKPSKRPNLVYPIFISADTGRYVRCGDSLEQRLEAGTLPGWSRAELDAWRPTPEDLTEDGMEVQWPFSDKHGMGTWRVGKETFGDLVEAGYVRIRPSPTAPGSNTRALTYISEGNRQKIEAGVMPVKGRDERDGSLLLGSEKRPQVPKSVWKRRMHDATNWGAPTLTALIGPNSFNYPKSPYAVRDTLASIVADRKDAVIVDFFAGSGTTLQATCMLNAADNGRRRTILVTNNEVADAEAQRLRAAGYAPGDPEWEKHGIFEEITQPRCEAAVTGVRPDGEPVEGEYDDGAAMAEGFAENVEFFKLTYEDPDRIRLGAAFVAVAPLLWLMAGAFGPRIDKITGSWSLPDGARYGVLFEPDQWADFAAAVRFAEHVTHAFVVTDSDAVFQQVVAELPDSVTPVRLYESYLRSFEINTGSGR